MVSPDALDTLPGSLKHLARFRTWEWTSALRDAFDAGAATARLNPDVPAEILWRDLGPEDDPSSWALEGELLAGVLDLATARAAFLDGVASVRQVPRP